jgi:uracil-DNA glycosylase
MKAPSFAASPTSAAASRRRDGGVRTLALAERPHPPPHSPRHTPHPPPRQHQHQHQQRQDFHQITQNWNVPRAPFKDFPAHQQAAIAAGTRGRGAAPPAAAAASAARQVVLAQVDKLRSVMAYEAQGGHRNFVGQSGETFASWAERALAALAPELAGADVTGAQRCVDLAQRLRGYGDTLSMTQRAAMVQEAGAVVGAAARALEGAPHPSRADRYAEALPPPAQAAAAQATLPVDTDDDALAAQAHAEETAEAAPAAGAAAATPAAAAASAPAPAADDPGYELVGGRRVKSQTAAFRRSFLESALAHDSAAAAPRVADLSGGEQRTAEWLAMRGRRLTASAFAKTLGFFPGDRVSLWEEKVGLREGFEGNEATRWGTEAEPRALAAYEAATGQRVGACMFQVKRDDAPHGWLGASPDGLIGGLSIADPGAPGAGPVQGAGAGVLEIKCPYNKGRPELAVPPRQAIWYYMPQVQGLMEIFDREWCNLYVWTPAGGSAAFHIPRDRQYWAACFDVLAEFWWAHVVPARQAHERGAGDAEVQALRPAEEHPAGRGLVQWSKRLAAAAPATLFAPLPPGRGG